MHFYLWFSYTDFYAVSMSLHLRWNTFYYERRDLTNPGLTILDTEYTSEDYAIGMSKDNTALYEAVNAALEELIADGTVKSIIDSYISAE